MTNEPIEASRFFAELEERDRRTPRWKKAYYSVRRVANYREIKYRLKLATVWPAQRARKGYSTYDTWGFDDYLAKVMAGGIRELQRASHGHPVGVCSCEDKIHSDKASWDRCDGEQRWFEILGTMAEGFELWRDRWEIDHHDREEYRRRHKEAEEKLQVSLLLLSKHFGALWD